MEKGRASCKKKKLIVDDHEVPLSSLDAVESNDDLLIEILLRLPPSSIFLFKSVSKRWLSLITALLSTTLRCSKKTNVEPPSGLFIQRYKPSPAIYDYVPFDSRFLVNRSPPVNTDFGLDFPDVEILQSCNGLLLCCGFIDKTTRNKQYCVYNPSTHLFNKLPPPCNYSVDNFYSNMGGMRLAFDPIKSPFYKLVFTEEKRDGSYYFQIQTYSSETGTWSICPEKFRARSEFLFFNDAIYWNNAFHWILGREYYKLDVEHLVLTTIQIPDHDVLAGMVYSCRLFESRGCLLLLCKYTGHLAIYEMTKGYSGWSMKYHVNVDDIMKLFPRGGRVWLDIIRGCYLVFCIVLGEKEEDSFLVMETRRGKVMQYKIVLKTVRELYDWDSPPVLHNYSTYPHCYQYYASFASV